MVNELSKFTKTVTASDPMMGDIVDKTVGPEMNSYADARLIIELFASQAKKAIDLLEQSKEKNVSTTIL